MPIALSIIAGWNIFIILWFAIGIGIGSFGITGFVFLGITTLVSLLIAVNLSRRLMPWFKSRSNLVRITLLVILIILTVIVFPKPYTYVI